MSDASSCSSLSSNGIIGYKEKQRYTAVDYHELFALKADQIGELRKLSRDIDDSAESPKKGKPISDQLQELNDRRIKSNRYRLEYSVR